MKNLRFDGKQLKLKNGGYSIDGYIELDSPKKLNYAERLELIKKEYEFDNEEIYGEMAEENEFTEQIGKALIFFVDGFAQEWTKEKANKLDELIG